MDNQQLSPVDRVRPVAGYVGGKRNLSRCLIQIINDTPHDLYAEAFVGMGGVFFRRTRRPAVEVINDISQDVTTLFRISCSATTNSFWTRLNGSSRDGPSSSG